jgi:hypothetical protein
MVFFFGFSNCAEWHCHKKREAAAAAAKTKDG